MTGGKNKERSPHSPASWNRMRLIYFTSLFVGYSSPHTPVWTKYFQLSTGEMISMSIMICFEMSSRITFASPFVVPVGLRMCLNVELVVPISRGFPA